MIVDNGLLISECHQCLIKTCTEMKCLVLRANIFWSTNIVEVSCKLNLPECLPECILIVNQGVIRLYSDLPALDEKMQPLHSFEWVQSVAATGVPTQRALGKNARWSGKTFEYVSIFAQPQCHPARRKCKHIIPSRLHNCNVNTVCIVTKSCLQVL